MHFPQGGEPLLVVALEVDVEGFLDVYPEERAHDFHRRHLGIRMGGFGGAFPQLLLLHKPVIDLAENSYDEGAKIHRRRPPFASADLALPSVRGCPRFFTSHRKNSATGLASKRSGALFQKGWVLIPPTLYSPHCGKMLFSETPAPPGRLSGI